MDVVDHLEVAKAAHDLTLRIYKLSDRFPSDEKYGLTSQLRRASVGIGSNLAEGDAHSSNRVFARHISIALGSAGETAYQLRLARDLGYLPVDENPELTGKLGEIRRMLHGLLRAVRKKSTERF